MHFDLHKQSAIFCLIKISQKSVFLQIRTQSVLLLHKKSAETLLKNPILKKTKRSKVD
jgi:hypothetical protein